jgi:6-phosphogluconolactonase
VSAPPPQIIVSTSAAALADEAASRAAATLRAALTARGQAHLVVTGGGILEQVLGALRAEPDVHWAGVHVWWGDERYVPADSDERNDAPAMSLLFDHVAVEPAHLHRMPASDAGFGTDADAAADSYAAELGDAAGGNDGTDSTVPSFDLVLLGVGPDGHCASLFPGHPGTAVLDASVIAVHDSPKPPPIRLSLTFPALDAAREVWFVASGDGKADAVVRALSGSDRVQVPASGPRGRDHTLWLIDEDAAAKLPTT